MPRPKLRRRVEAEEAEPEFESRPPAKLERLQKILAQAGVASRRKAEEMIEQGRVQVNGKVVTVLGTKADAARDHIRVDGKLLHGSERLRYFVLNKPRGFVTTVKDPEGRPTVMQFFEKISERLYPVGRLDYMSEGLLLVTNDGELANRLTHAGSGVEKTYLVKVAGQPTEAELDILRGGVSIERGKPGSGQVRTAPARIRQVRQGDNPWYEVVLIEGRNRELRKMFEEIGHFVEKIRRVGYGPLVLDQEPGNLRELEPEELAALRAAAEGKLRTPKSKELRRRNAMDAQLPTAGAAPQPFAPGHRPHLENAPAPLPGDYRAKKSYGAGRPSRPPTRTSAPHGPHGRSMIVLPQANPTQTDLPLRGATAPNPTSANPMGVNPPQARRMETGLLPAAPMARDRAAALRHAPAALAPAPVTGWLRELSVPLTVRPLGSSAPSAATKAKAHSRPEGRKKPDGNPDPGPLRTGPRPWGGSPAASPNPATRANPPAPGGQALPAERGAAKRELEDTHHPARIRAGFHQFSIALIGASWIASQARGSAHG